MDGGILLNPTQWRVSRTAFLVALASMIATIAVLFNLDPEYSVRWMRDYTVYALILGLPALIAVRLRTVGLSLLWLLIPCVAIVIGAVAVVGIIVAMTGAGHSSGGATTAVHIGIGGLIALAIIIVIAAYKSEWRLTPTTKNDV